VFFKRRQHTNFSKNLYQVKISFVSWSIPSDFAKLQSSSDMKVIPEYIWEKQQINGNILREGTREEMLNCVQKDAQMCMGNISNVRGLCKIYTSPAFQNCILKF